MKKSLLLISAAAIAMFGFVSCGGEKKSAVQEVIAQAENMSFEEICQKAIEESKTATLKGIGNSSRGKTAGASFIDYLKSIDSSYEGKIEWSQPKNNSIFTTLNLDAKSANPEYFMTLIQDGNQIQSKMMDTGVLRTFIPKEWSEANNGAKPELLPLQTLNKVFMYNNVKGAKYSNCWEFVMPGTSGLYMDVNSELVGKNFLYMLTADKYAGWLKNAYDKLDDAKKAVIAPVVEECEAKAKEFNLESANAKYGLAFAKLWVTNYNAQTDDGPICNDLVKKSAADQFALIVYSKLRSVAETTESSVNNVSVAAYEDGYEGIGGYGYCHYLEVMNTSPYPWTACAFISYMVNKTEGFKAWGKDMGGYSANPKLAAENEEIFHHSTAGGDKFPVKNDRGYDWWTSEGNGELVVEDPVYCSTVSVNLSDWVDLVRSQK